jgi:hypothetical protein
VQYLRQADKIASTTYRPRVPVIAIFKQRYLYCSKKQIGSKDRPVIGLMENEREHLDCTHRTVTVRTYCYSHGIKHTDQRWQDMLEASSPIIDGAGWAVATLTSSRHFQDSQNSAGTLACQLLLL